MGVQLQKLQVFVEGKNDQHALVHVLRKHHVPYPEGRAPIPEHLPSFKAVLDEETVLDETASNDEAVLNKITSAIIETHANRSVGFIIDADENLAARQHSVEQRLQRAGVDVPIQPFADGFIGESSRYKTRVGVWLMPDNQNPGALENFLTPLIPAGYQPLFHLAISSTASARALLQQSGLDCFRDVDQLKAQLACWLAWRKKPGLPYGTAVKAGYLNANENLSEKFAVWFKTLFNLTV